MERHILWHPEPGICSCCGKDCNKVRRFTTEKSHAIYCFSCWNGAQEGCFVSSLDWADDEAVAFLIEESKSRELQPIWN
jgi:predicted amidophosphoribosyltransferase